MSNCCVAMPIGKTDERDSFQIVWELSIIKNRNANELKLESPSLLTFNCAVKLLRFEHVNDRDLWWQ